MEKFTESFRVPSYEVKNDYSLKLSAFINHMQEISSLHASANGCGQEHIIPKGFAWMISRYHIRVEDFPKMNDRVSISTWVFGNSDPFTVREYSLKDKNGKYLI